VCTGRTLKGIHFAVSFLETWQKKQSNKPVDYLALLAKDKNVVVVGGGDTGCDCIGTAIRQVCVTVIDSRFFIGGGDRGGVGAETQDVTASGQLSERSV